MTSRSRIRGSEAGIGLVELMITLSLTAVALAAIYGAFFRTQRAAGVVVAEVGARQGVRGALQIIERDLRMAGSGWGRTQVDGAWSGSPLQRFGVNHGFGGNGNDSISVLGAWDAGTTLRDVMPDPSSLIPCVSTAGFVTGDLVVVTDEASAHLFQVTGVTASPANLDIANSSPFNASGGHLNWPGGLGNGYGAGTRVFKAGWVSYRIDSTAYDRPSLVRWAVGLPPQLVAYDIEMFHVWYRLSDGSLTRDPVNLSMIDQVIPVLQSAPQGNTTAAEDSIHATVRPRAF